MSVLLWVYPFDMKILFIIQWFQPEPALKGLPFARELVKLGHEVQVLTGYPNYPGGRIYEGYRVRFFQREVMEGVSVLRVPLYPSHDGSSVRRIANYLSYAFSASVMGPWVIDRADVAYVYHPPATTYLPASAVKLFRRIPLVYDIQDFWPDSLAASGMFKNRFGLWLVDQYCRTFYKVANKITVLSPGFKQKLIDKGLPPEKIEVVYNWCDDSQILSADRDSKLADKLGLTGKFNVIFAGNMGKVQALETVLKAAQILSSTCPRVQFVLVGDGVDLDNLKQKTKQMGLGNVLFIPRMSPSEVGKVLVLADVLLVHLMKDPLFRITIPSKIQAYMAVGKPILAAVPGDAADLIEQAQAGLFCEPENPPLMAEAVRQFCEMPAERLAEMGTRGKDFYFNRMALKAGAKRFEEIFQSVARKKGS
jgi:colanic acid biosynthesis glycosyl transferase WcaI